MLWGGKFDRIRQTPLGKKRSDKKGFLNDWTITLKETPKWVIETWKTGQAYGNISEYTKARIKLKKIIKRELTSFK